MYRITFSDRTQVSVDNEQGLKLMEIQASTRKPDYININDSQYRLSTITKVIKVPDNITATTRLIESKPISHEKSIHEAILKLYTKELLKENPRKWEEFRAKAYDYLYTQSSKWCDDRKGTCVCKNRVDNKRVDEIMQIMKS